MKKYKLIILFLLIASSAFAQQDTTTIFQSARGYYVDPLRGKFDKKVYQKDSLWVVDLYNKKDELQESVSFADKKLEIRKGPYLLNVDGNLKVQGYYIRGYKIGEWKTYYPNKKLKEKANFRWDLLNGAYISYWPNGILKKQGTYQSERKINDWNMYYEDGKPALKESYDEMGKLVSSTYFDIKGNRTQLPNNYISPSYPNGLQSFYDFLFKEIKDNKSNAIYATYGTIRVEFIVKRDGTLTDITINGSDDDYLNKEIIRVMKLAGNWYPAVELGDPIRSRHIIPIKFFSN